MDHMGVSIVMGVPNSWMVFVREHPSYKTNDEWGLPVFQETFILTLWIPVDARNHQLKTVVYPILGNPHMI